MKKTLILFMCICFAVQLGLCYEPQDFFEFYSVFSPDAKTVIMPDKLIVDIAPGQSQDITIVTKPENLKVLWQNQNPDICSLTQESDVRCTVHAKAVGQGEILLSHPKTGTRIKVHVNVKEIKPRIYFDTQKINLEVGQTHILRAYIEPENANEKIKWSVNSSDEYAAVSVGDNICKIRGLNKGHFKVSAALADGKRAEAEVEVTASDASLGYKSCLALLFSGAAVLLIYAWYLNKRMKKDEKE